MIFIIQFTEIINGVVPINLGPRINSSSDEYRPVIGFSESYTNYYLIFSSNRSGGKGGFDLYFTGIKFPK